MPSGKCFQKMPSCGAKCFHAFFPVEMASFMFLSEHRDTKAMFYLFYKITSVLRQKKTHNFTQLISHLCLCTPIQNENDVNTFI